jgi:hypothetical protein
MDCRVKPGNDGKIAAPRCAGTRKVSMSPLDVCGMNPAGRASLTASIVDAQPGDSFTCTGTNRRAASQVAKEIAHRHGDPTPPRANSRRSSIRSSFAYTGKWCSVGAVGETDRVLTLLVERSSYPNQNGVSTKRPIATLTANELRLTDPGNLVGSTDALVWRRGSTGLP